MNGAVIGSPSYYTTDGIRIARTSSKSGVWDGPVPSNGDSGGPLMVTLDVNRNGNPQRFILGTDSGGYQSDSCNSPPGNGYQHTDYSTAFTAENGMWLEKTVAYWRSADYANRANGWHSEWEDRGVTPGGAVSSGPGASSQFYNSVDAFVTGPDRKIYQDNWNGARWSFVGPITNDVVTSPPASASWAPGRIDVVARADDGSLLHAWYASGWHSEKLGGYILLGTSPAITTGSANTLHIFVIGGDGSLYHKSYDPIRGWQPSLTGFENLGAYMAGMTSSPAAVAWSSNRLDVFAQRADNKVVHIYNEGAAAPQLGWQFGAFSYFSTPVSRSSGVAVASSLPGRIDVVARSGNDPNQLVHWWHDDQGWSSPVSNVIAGGLPGSTPALASWWPGRLDLFSQDAGSNAHLLHMWFPN
jgi:hypothetical protein